MAVQKTARRQVVLAVVALVLTATVGPAAAASGTTADLGDEYDAPAFIVELHEDGSATVVLTYTFNLSDDSRQAAFEEIRDNQTDREEFRTDFETRFQNVANASAIETGRAMSVSNTTLDFRSSDTTGVVEAKLTWNGLAAVEGNNLTVTEPFASGFSLDRPVHMRGPSEYSVESVTHSAASTADGTLTYQSGTDFSGFELVVAGESHDDGTADGDTHDDGETHEHDENATDDETTETATTSASNETTDGETEDSGEETPGESGPGFGLVVALGALLATGLLVRHSD